MSTTTDTETPFRSTSPGDLITAELMNDIQVQTRKEIARRVAEGVASVKEVDRARDSQKLEGKALNEITDQIIELAKAILPGLTQHRVVYKRLYPGEAAVIRHGLRTYPLVDVYQLASFPAVVSADEQQRVEDVHWYLYHRTEMKIRNPEPAGERLITIEESRGPVFKHGLESMLTLYKVRYDGQSTLGDVVNEFWKALFSGANDQFDETSFGNSPWFDRCCGDRRTVDSLKRGGEWNDLYLKVRPVKTINAAPPPLPLPVLVEHYNLDEVGLTWLAGEAAAQAQAQAQAIRAEPDASVPGDKAPDLVAVAGPAPSIAEKVRVRLGRQFSHAQGGDAQPGELRVMVLLKV